MNKAVERVLKAVRYERPDRLPTYDWFWPEFMGNWHREKGRQLDIYDHYRLDVRNVGADISPNPASFKILEKTDQHVVFRNGWGMLCRKVHDAAMLEFLEFPVQNEKDFSHYAFFDPAASRRYNETFVDDLSLDTVPPFTEQAERYGETFCLLGAVLDPYESLWRLRGVEQILIDMIDNPRGFKMMISEVTEFMIQIGLEQIRAGHLPAIIILGDVAFKNGPFFSPQMYRDMIFPHLRKMVSCFKAEGTLVFYHTDGNCSALIDMFIEAGIDVLNPIEVAAGMDLTDLKRKYGKQLAYMGGFDKRRLFDKQDIEDEVKSKVNAFPTGGLIASIDHSVGPDIPVENYEYYLELIKEINIQAMEQI